MKIIYLKPAPCATIGDIKDIDTMQAQILIRLGLAKAYDGAQKKSRAPKALSEGGEKDDAQSAHDADTSAKPKKRSVRKKTDADAD